LGYAPIIVTFYIYEYSYLFGINKGSLRIQPTRNESDKTKDELFTEECDSAL